MQRNYFYIPRKKNFKNVTLVIYNKKRGFKTVVNVNMFGMD